jgi:4-diphosphocytidyl-2-C-methyl-D-erythritol kinase
VTTTREAPAKINLWLRVGGRQRNGFHQLDTLFCALDLADTVHLARAPAGSGIRLRTSFAPPLRAPPHLGPATANLAVRAGAAFLQRAGLPQDLDIELVKRIPPGGGLGGGSSDAAAVLRALDGLHPGAVLPAQLQELAASLGSDVPFFASGQPLARGRGRGERLMPAAPLPERGVLLVFPPLRVSTTAAYRWLDEDRDRGEAPPAGRLDVPPLRQLDWQRVGNLACNDFETVVFRRHPELAACRDLLTHHGAAPALLAGSGATLFGVFHDAEGATAAAEHLERQAAGVQAVITRTRSR